MSNRFFLDPTDVEHFSGVILDCRFALGDAEAGRREYESGHLPGALYLDLERDLSAPVAAHGGRHPLPAPDVVAARLAALGITPETPTLLYDDSRYAFAARAWWMLRALGFAPPRLLAGGYTAWLESGGVPDQETTPAVAVREVPLPAGWPLCCDREQLQALQAEGATLVDAREPARYRGEQEPIDPIAGHIPGAVNRPWQAQTDDQGLLLSEPALRSLWGELLDARPLVAYCGSGVSACVDILALATLGREDVWLYAGSWSDWCSYLEVDA